MAIAGGPSSLLALLAGPVLLGCNDPVGLPRALPANQTFLDVAAAMSQTCALTGDHRTFCWLYDSAFAINPVPVRLELPEPLDGIEAGSGIFGAHFCGQGESGAVYCWGAMLSIDVVGRIGDGRTPVKIGDGFLRGSLAVGSGHACALGPDSTARCWGSYNSAKRGVVGPYPGPSPFPGISHMDLTVTTVMGGERFLALSASDHATCGIRADHTVACWGDSASVGAPRNVYVHDDETCFLSLACTARPVLVGSMTGVYQLAAGGRHTCALGSPGALCWGNNGAEVFGRPDPTLGATPVPLTLPIVPMSLAAGGLHTCALSAAGVAWCVGTNWAGQFGAGFVGGSSGPTRVRFNGQFARLFAGHAHTCGIDTRGLLYCWGDVHFASSAPWVGAIPVRLTVPD